MTRTRYQPTPADTAAAARRLAEAIITSTTVDQAIAEVAPVGGRLVDATAQLLGVTVHGRVADRRHQLVQHTVGVALTHAVIGYNRDPEGAAAYLARWRARRLAQLDPAAR